jgi:hypothetical protein
MVGQKPVEAEGKMVYSSATDGNHFFTPVGVAQTVRAQHS